MAEEVFDFVPPLVPLSFAAAGCMGLMLVALTGQRKLAEPVLAIASILYAMAAVCGIADAIAAVPLEVETIVLFAILSALSFGTFGFAAEIVVLVYSAFVQTIRAHRWR